MTKFLLFVCMSTLGWVVFCHPLGAATIPEEEALLGLWQYHEASKDHADFIAAAESFEKQFPKSAYRRISRTLVAWHLLQQHEEAKAEKILEGLRSASSNAFDLAADRIAKSWLTRLDRERARTALRAVYAKQIAYPTAFPTTIQPATDRWGKPWVYRLKSTKFIKGFSSQTYQLDSPTLGATSDLRTALRIPFGSRIRLVPLRKDGEVVTFSEPGRRDQFVLGPGAEAGLVMFVDAGQQVLVLADLDHWRIVPSPKK